MGNWLAVASAWGLLASQAGATAADLPRAATVEPKVDQLFKEYDRPNGPGCAVGVYNAGRIIFAKGYGQADLEAKRAITPNSVFDIASLSKQFTAFAIALLEREGKLSLDASVRRYVPELPDFAGPITVRHLVHHTSGLRDYGALMEFTGWTLDQELSKDRMLALLTRQRELNFAPGSQHEYGNTNYVLLGMIIERVSGRSYGDFLAERIFRPLGMTSSIFGTKAAAARPHLARNYRPDGNGFAVNHVWAKAYAPGVVTVHSSIEDLARWDANFFAPTVGDAGLIERLYSPARLLSGELTSYGYGLFVGTHRGLETVAHSGLGGGSFYLLRFPTERLSIATLCNQYGVGPQAPDSYSLSYAVADLFLPSPEAGSKRSEVVAARIAVSRAELEAYVGNYWKEDEPTPISFRLDAKGLSEVYGGKLYPMIPTGPGQFRNEDGTATYSFTGPEREMLTYRELPINLLERAERRPGWTPTVADLRPLAGRYCSSEIELCWSIEPAGREVWLVRPGFPRKLLDPAFADTFRLVDRHWIGTRNVRITLERTSDGAVSAFRVSRGRARNLLFERTP